MANYSEKIVMSIGGSLIVPNGGIDSKFLKDLNKFIRGQLAKNKNRQFFLITGGGMTTRHYQKAASDVIGRQLTEDDLDWIGIHATRLNGHLLRTIFRDIAHPIIIDDYSTIRKPTEPVIVGAGWKPGWSTDYDAVLVCEDYGPRTVINLSNISQVYNKDPKKFTDAKPLDQVSWADFRKIIGDKWSPGMNAPFDPIAAKKAQELGVKVILMGKDFDNIRKYFKGEKFLGTVIE
ncbi:MAG: UMP kinase [Candidatus Levybacteria bacterium CG_4_9_14_3_um_filter_35_16]|nr:MAG: UMP kinase [Candidatus Levybacteria bacterium CG22_combo_CG10-13_8_21_14_all_35_11]PJA91031.1 MAG: UMP kinase [Candidatus Levybacteria bacterium CG_4_9_14_3_um_filter_35_16]PJC54732.1 MAG: UMP kinase [Candidatus Levybacteria bacterium CG_4_9_14_0_2_um_filter_35_21]